MLIETFEAGPVATNGYLVCDHPGGRALVIDAPLGKCGLNGRAGSRVGNSD